MMNHNLTKPHVTIAGNPVTDDPLCQGNAKTPVRVFRASSHPGFLSLCHFLRHHIPVAWACASLLLSASAFAQTAVVPPGDGLTPATAYQVSQLGHLVWMGDTVTSSTGKYYELMNDVDASGTANWNDVSTTTDTLEGFRSIGTYSYPDTTSFRGIFDGGGHKITGLTINRGSTDYIGLFGRIGSGGGVENLGLEGGVVTGFGSVGGLAGRNDGVILNCYASSAVTSGSSVGGLAGESYGMIASCYATGAVTGFDWVGGLVGYNEGAIANCYASGAVVSTDLVGGLTGYNAGTIANCYATGAVTGFDYVGGLAGYNDYGGTISNCYATGAVTAGTYVGGLDGYNSGGTITNCYWDTESTGQATSAGGTGKTTAQMKQQATFQPGGGAGPNDWGFTAIWGISATINSGYPYLRAAPSILSFAINNGAASTTSRTVTLDNVCANVPTEFQASEAADFSGAAWLPYATAPAFSLSAGNGVKTVYFKVKNITAESSVTSATIVLNETAVVAPTVTSFAIDNGAPGTSSGNVTLNNACTNAPTEYQASEAANFSGAAWLPYATAPTFALSAGNGVKTVYFKVRNTAGESAVASDTITFGVADFTFTSQRIKSSHAETWSKQVQSVASKDKYSFSATAQLPTTFALATLDAGTTVTIMVGGILFEDTLGHAGKNKLLAPDKGGSATFTLKANVAGKSHTVQTIKVSWTAKKVLKVTLVGAPPAGNGSVIDNIVDLTAASDGTVSPQVPTFVAFGTVFGEDSGVACSGWKKTKAASGAGGTNLTSWSVSGKR